MDFRIIGTSAEIEEFEKRIALLFHYKLNAKIYPNNGGAQLQESPKPDQKVRRYGHFYFYPYDDSRTIYELLESEKTYNQELAIQLGKAEQRINQLEAQLGLIPKDAAVLSPRHTNRHTP